MHDPSHGSGQEVEAYFAGRVGSGQEVFEISRVGSFRVGSDRVGSGRVGSGRVGSGRVGSGRVGSGRVGSGYSSKRIFKYDTSGRVTLARPDP